MGSLRIFLAFIVLLSHSQFVYGRGDQGQLAVEGFFIISGFYMALLLERKKYPTLRAFYLSRWWRLWPIFLVASVVMLIAREIGGHSWIALVRSQNFDLGLVTLLSNTFMMGLDALFYAQSHGLTYGDRQSSILIIPQAWSLSLEVPFFLLCPLLNRFSTMVLVAVALISQAIRWLTLAHLGYDDSFWTYRFFPFESGLFIAGMIAYRIWNNDSQHTSSTILGALGCFFALTAFAWPIPFELSRAVFLITLFLGVPKLFALSEFWPWDRWVGDLSYSFYLWHLLPLAVIARQFTGHPVLVMGAATLVTLMLSALSQTLIQSPVDQWRHRFASRYLTKKVPDVSTPRPEPNMESAAS